MRGGARVGAGRKPLENPRKRLVMYVTEEERESIENLLAKLRRDDGPIDLTYQVEEYANAQESKTLENSAVESKVEEPAAEKKKYTPTIATAAEIVEIERLNHGMTRGKWDCIAGIMNKKLRYNEQLEPWTAITVKKAFLKARKAQA